MQKNKKPNRQPKVSYETQLLIFNDYLKPYQAHLISGEIKKRWKVKKK